MDPTKVNVFVAKHRKNLVLLYNEYFFVSVNTTRKGKICDTLAFLFYVLILPSFKPDFGLNTSSSETKKILRNLNMTVNAINLSVANFEDAY